MIRQYHGDSRARWDGDTLVVDTTNYVANATRVGATEKLHTIEKFRRVAQDTLEYYVTFDDPTVWSRPWTLMIPLEPRQVDLRSVPVRVVRQDDVRAGLLRDVVEPLRRSRCRPRETHDRR